MFRPKRMKKFYVAVPRDKEDDVVEALGRLGVVEFISQAKASGRGDVELEAYSSFLRLYDRIGIAINSIEEILPKEEVKKPFLVRLKEGFTLKGRRTSSQKITVDELRVFLSEVESEYSKLTSELDEKRRRLSELDSMLRDIEVFRKNNISLDIMGDYTHIFVKAGFIPEVNVGKLMEALKPFNVVISLMEGRPKENFLLIAASQKDKENIMGVLTALNFEEIIFPSDIGTDPDEVYKKFVKERKEIFKAFEKLRGKFESLKSRLQPYLRYVRFMYRVKSMLVRTRNFSVIYGWTPSDKVDEVKRVVDEVTKGVMHIEISDPKPGEKPPTLLSQPPLLNRFQLIVRMRGVPNYNEIDPTLPFTILFSIMYGMMFGDVGQGIVLFIIGQILYRIKKPMMGISYSALNRLGAILSTASIFSIVFGFLYGESFLMHFMEPLWLNPLDTPLVIAVFSIVFGLIQLNLGLILNIANNLLNRNYLEALLSWRGVLGMIYYIIGIFLAVRFILGGWNLGVFGAPENLPLVIIELILLSFSLLKPTVVSLLSKHKHPFSETLMEGISEFIEMFLSYITNSISYIRLGAFAIAHAALAQAAHTLASPGNPYTASLVYLLFNIIVILIEGFAAGIQSIRLLFYEFSTKFYIDDGKLFSPNRL